MTRVRRHRLLALALAATALPVLAPTPAAAAPPAGACQDAEPAHPVVAALPWAQQLLDPDRVWPESRGAGVLVAVVDSGVDTDHPQLRRPGKVLPGKDFYTPGGEPATFDCESHGTEVASIVAADPVSGVGFHGVAPDARILPVRVTNRELNDQGQTLQIDPQEIANGIRYAVDQGAGVINLSLAGTTDFPAVRDAVGYAVSRNVVVVAAAGNQQQNDTTELPSYPAGYPGVLGVGAVDINGARASTSQFGPYVSIVAPGAGVLAATRVAGQSYVDGTSFATAFVSGAAALVRAAWPQLSAAQVIQRLEATASPARGGRDSAEYGAGVVDPYRAVTDQLDPRAPADLPAYVPKPPDQAELARLAEQRHVDTVATWLAAGALGVLLLAAAAAVVLRRARRRHWRPAQAARLPAEPEIVEPPEQIFLLDR
ncbi:type VII secretion-associated serine protease mycosin [Kutzneria sp. CA-103260]|uniref:type VII secretion-associated serine protease mycosin n=1 Tax=Kutzneria sp. CA-103260 TaxID=2802641 RepID=UPI001BA745F9